ncbi:MAG: leucine-rich repeat domain-containing protein [Aureliella sp.]
MNFTFRNSSAALVLALTLVGCRPSNPAPSEAEPSASSASKTQVPQKSDPPEVLKTLEAGGAELQRGPSGAVSQVAFRESPLTDALAGALASLEQLQTLTIAQSEMTAAGWQHISQLKQLRQLDLRECSLGNEDFAAAISGLSELQVLRMSGKNGATTVDDTGIVALKACPKLKVLAGDYLWISEVGLAELSSLKELRELYLANTLVDDAALARIAAMPSIKKLRIAKTGIGREGLEHLTTLSLEELDLSECININDDALEPVGKLVSLKKLNLWRDAIGDAGVAHLAGLKNLEWLNIDNTQLTDEGLKSFAGYSKLSFLHLGSTAVTDAGMPELAKLKSLKELKVTRTSVTEEGVKPLRQALPGIDIQLKYGEE